MALVNDKGNVEHYDGRVRVVDADAQPAGRVRRPGLPAAHRRDGRRPVVPQADLPEVSGPTTASTGSAPLARAIVGTPSALRARTSCSGMFRERFGIAPRSSFHYHYTRLLDILFCLERMEQLLLQDDILSPRVLREGRGQQQRGDRRLRGTTRHPDPPLHRRRRRHHRDSQPCHRHRSQRVGDEPQRASGRSALRTRRDDPGGDAQPGRGGHPLLRPVSVVLHARDGSDAACTSQLLRPDGSVADEVRR